MNGMNREPQKPSDEQCCGQGCKTCVFDLYDQELSIWLKSQHQPTVLCSESEIFMSADSYTECILDSIEPQTDGVKVLKYNFRLPQGVGLSFEAGQHLVVKNAGLVRPYTLISKPGKVLDQFTVLIKLYDDGEMSQVIASWSPGSVVQWRGPLGGPLNYEANTFKSVLLIAAGTGIAPIYQLANRIIDNEEDETKIVLLYACRTYDAILLRADLHRMQSYWNFSVETADSPQHHTAAGSKFFFHPRPFWQKCKM